MEISIRSARAAGVCLLVVFALCATIFSPCVLAQQEDPDGQEGAAPATVDERERAKQARIEEYLRKKEERRARRELARQQREAERDAKKAAEVDVAPASPAEVTKDRKKKKDRDRGSRPVSLPRHLAQAQSIVWASPLAEDPTVTQYLELIDRAEASPQQLGAFANFLAQNGMTRVAFEYYDVALSVDRDDPVLWMNIGTLHRQLREFPAAAKAYEQALRIDPSSAFAHYNLGAVFDQMDKYEAAIDEYRIALTLDPTLGDPAVNPQAANNERLLAVKLMLYEEQAGSLGLPLIDVPGGELGAVREE
jgi:tetratricopeptide (TPR) repeat protein